MVLKDVNCFKLKMPLHFSYIDTRYNKKFSAVCKKHIFHIVNLSSYLLFCSLVRSSDDNMFLCNIMWFCSAFSSEDNGRELRITAGFKHVKAKKGTAIFDLIEEYEEKPMDTP